MKPTNFSLVSSDVDFRGGGSFRHVYQRASGNKIEVRSTYKLVDPRIYASKKEFAATKSS
jgi:hypothetical protein